MHKPILSTTTLLKNTRAEVTTLFVKDLKRYSDMPAQKEIGVELTFSVVMYNTDCDSLA